MERVDVSRAPVVALLLGAIGLVGGVLLASGDLVYQSWLLAFLFWVGLSLGSLVMLVVGHMAGGGWSALVQRPLEASVSLLPIMALLFLPVLFGMNALFVWTDAAYVADHPLVAAKTAYLNAPFFVVRAALYFGLWILAAWLYLRGSAHQDRDAAASGRIGYGLKRQSGLWLIVYVLTMTFAGRDWAMSLTPEWWSGIYAVILMSGQAISAVALVILTVVALAGRNAKVDALLTETRLQDLGNFLMAFLMFWAYVSFSQLIIIWSGNVSELAGWYTVRLGPGWLAVGGFLLAFGFLAPFVILFSRWVKRKRSALSIMAVWALAVMVVNLIYFVVPAFERGGFPITLADAAIFVGIGGVWAFFYLRRLAAHPVLPVHDPRLKGADPHA